MLMVVCSHVYKWSQSRGHQAPENGGCIYIYICIHIYIYLVHFQLNAHHATLVQLTAALQNYFWYKFQYSDFNLVNLFSEMFGRLTHPFSSEHTPCSFSAAHCSCAKSFFFWWKWLYWDTNLVKKIYMEIFFVWNFFVWNFILQTDPSICDSPYIIAQNGGRKPCYKSLRTGLC